MFRCCRLEQRSQQQSMLGILSLSVAVQLNHYLPMISRTFSSMRSALFIFIVLSVSASTRTSAFQVAPNKNPNSAKTAPPSAATFAEEFVTKATGGFASPNSFQCTQITSSNGADFSSALDELLQDWTIPSANQPAIGCLFVSTAFAPYLTNLVQRAQTIVGDHTKLLTVVGGGVVGAGNELEDSCSLSFLGGSLPEDSSVELFSASDDGLCTALPEHLTESASSASNREPSHLVFADPHCHEIHSVLEQINGIVAGGISVASPNQASLAIGTRVLPPGSLIGATFSGNVGLQVVVSQGSRPVGPVYRVTRVDGPAVHELGSARAIDCLQDVMEFSKQQHIVSKLDSDDFLGGIHKDETTSSDHHNVNVVDEGDKPPDDFILRQMTGFRPRSGSILICGPQIQPGDFFRFHVQSKETALEDWRSTLKRADTERLFLGDQAGTALGALQISCMGRGQGLFGIPNVDLRHVEQLLPPNTPVAGVMANAEIGPVGIRMGTSETCKSVLHGFASVVALLCDFSESPLEAQSLTTSPLANSTMSGAWE